MGDARRGRTSSSARSPARTSRSPRTSSTSPARSRCSSTCRTRTARSPRWCASHAAMSSSPCPREPLWRALNLAAGRVRARAGQYARPREPLVAGRIPRLRQRARPDSRRSARPSRGPWSLSGPRSYGRGAAVLSVGIGVTGLVTYTYFSLASHSLADDEYGRIALLWSAVFIVVSVLYRPVEQLLSRTIAEQSRARARAARGRHDPGRARDRVRRRRARAARTDRGRPLRRLLDALLDLRRDGRRVRGELLRAWLPRGPPPLRARTGCSFCSRPPLGVCSRWPWPLGSARGKTRLRSAWSPRRS